MLKKGDLISAILLFEEAVSATKFPFIISSKGERSYKRLFLFNVKVFSYCNLVLLLHESSASGFD